MQTRLLVSIVGLGLVARLVLGCGGPALDDFEHGANQPEVGGATVVAIGSRARGGSAGNGAVSRGGAASGGRPSKAEGGKAAASGGVAMSPAEPEPVDGAGGAAPAKGGAASGARAAAGSQPATSGGATGGSGSASGDGGDASAGADPASDGGEQGGTAPSTGGGQAGAAPEPVGGAPSAGGESSGGAPAVVEPPERTLWFSEYVEGTKKFKALEIAALSEQPLSGCQIEVFANGETSSPSKWALDGTISPAAPLVVCTKELKAELEAQGLDASCLDRSLSFNGDDAVVLRCEGRVIDALGQVGLPLPENQQWGAGELRTLDMTLRRTCSVTAGDAVETDAFDPALEWEAAATDDFSGLGTHCAPPP